MDKLRALLFLVVALVGGFVASNAIQERAGHVHTSIDWLGGVLVSSIGVALDLGYRWRFGKNDGWRRYVGEGGAALLYVPFWSIATVGLVASLSVFFGGGARW
jgi:hypothetical protein